MAESAAQLDDLETWRNIGAARFVIKKFSAKGDIMDEMINGGRQFHLTSRERHINTEMAASADQDPFSNGMFSPVRLLETTEDAEAIAANPNLIGESEMAALLKFRIDAFRRRLETITNPVVLERLLVVAAETDSPVSKVEAVKTRITEVSPTLASEQPAPESPGGLGGVIGGPGSGAGRPIAVR